MKKHKLFKIQLESVDSNRRVSKFVIADSREEALNFAKEFEDTELKCQSVYFLEVVYCKEY
jgi:hypothetical protein